MVSQSDEQVRTAVGIYLADKRPRHYHRGIVLAFRSLLDAEPREGAGLELLKRAYSDIGGVPAELLTEYAALRKEIAIFLKGLTGEEYRYTALKRLPYR